MKKSINFEFNSDQLTNIVGDYLISKGEIPKGIHFDVLIDILEKEDFTFIFSFYEEPTLNNQALSTTLKI